MMDAKGRESKHEAQKKSKRYSKSNSDHGRSAPNQPFRSITKEEAGIKFVKLAGVSVAVALITIYGLFGDNRIRPNPFDPSVNLTTVDWWLYPQPHSALQKIPVVPIGARGTLTYRPKNTSWINSPYYPQVFTELSNRKDEQTTLGKTLIGSAAAQAGENTKSTTKVDVETGESARRSQNEVSKSAESSLDAVPDTAIVIPTSRAGESRSRPKVIPPRRDVEPLRMLSVVCDHDGKTCLIAGEDTSESKEKTLKNVLLKTVDNSTSTGSSVLEILDWRRWIDALGELATVLPTGRKISLGFATSISSNDLTEFELSQRKFAGAKTAQSEEPSPQSYTWLRRQFGEPNREIEWKRLSDTSNRMWGLEIFKLKNSTLVLDQNGRLPKNQLGIEAFIEVGAGSNLPIVPKISAKNTAVSFNYLKVRDSVNRKAIALGDKGAIVSIELDDITPLAGAGSGGSIKTYSVIVKQSDKVTNSNLRNLYFQEDGNRDIGWASSGWNDGNEEGARPAVLQTIDGGVSWERLSYHVGPAPIILIIAVPGMLIVFYLTGFAYRDYLYAKDASFGIEDIGISDQPIGWSDRDVLGLRPIAKSLSRFVRNKETLPPLTIAITGAWGSGKSSLMNLVSEDLRRIGTRPVWFNAWHHQVEEHLLAALLANIRSQAIPPLWRLSGWLFRGRLLLKRIRRNFMGWATFAVLVTLIITLFDKFVANDALFELIANRFFDTQANGDREQDNLLQSIEGVFEFGIAATVIAALTFAMKALTFLNVNPASLMSTLSKKAGVKEFADQLSFRHKFACEFEDLCDCLRYGRNAGVVIMIDDLDRCSSKNLLEVLEAVNFLATAGKCFIFLGIDEEKVVKEVAEKYKENGSDGKGQAKNYLEKLLNITVKVPKATSDQGKALVTAEESEVLSYTGSRWADRVRKLLRSAPDVLLIPLALSGLLFAIPPAFNGATERTSTEVQSPLSEVVKKTEDVGNADKAGEQSPKQSDINLLVKEWLKAESEIGQYQAQINYLNKGDGSKKADSQHYLLEARAKLSSARAQSETAAPQLQTLLRDPTEIVFLAASFLVERELEAIGQHADASTRLSGLKGSSDSTTPAPSGADEKTARAEGAIDPRVNSDILDLIGKQAGAKRQLEAIAKIKQKSVLSEVARSKPSIPALVPSLIDRDLRPNEQWPYYLWSLIIALGLGLSGLRHSTILKEDMVEDSASFRDALRIWHEVVFVNMKTPRSLKRYQNRLRFFAMQLRPTSDGTDWIDASLKRTSALYAKITGKDHSNDINTEKKVEKSAEKTSISLPDELLVAFGALNALSPEILENEPEKLEQSLKGVLSELYKTRLGKEDSGERKTDVETAIAVAQNNNLWNAIANHKNKFPESWPPTQEQINAFRKLMG